MGTADYCLIVVVLFFGLMVWSLKQDEKRRHDRRETIRPRAGGEEHRSGGDRRDNSLMAFMLWRLRSQWQKLTHRS